MYEAAFTHWYNVKIKYKILSNLKKKTIKNNKASNNIQLGVFKWVVQWSVYILSIKITSGYR